MAEFALSFDLFFENWLKRFNEKHIQKIKHNFSNLTYVLSVACASDLLWIFFYSLIMISPISCTIIINKSKTFWNNSRDIKKAITNTFDLLHNNFYIWNLNCWLD